MTSGCGHFKNWPGDKRKLKRICLLQNPKLKKKMRITTVYGMQRWTSCWFSKTQGNWSIAEEYVWHKNKKICLVYLYTWSFFERKFKDKCIRVVTNTLSVHSGWHKAKDLLEVVPFSTWLYLLEKQLNPIIKYLVEDTYITAWVSFVSHS